MTLLATWIIHLFNAAGVAFLLGTLIGLLPVPLLAAVVIAFVIVSVWVFLYARYCLPQEVDREEG